MGATDFHDSARGKTAKDAFRAAREEAAWESGHGGYTGTVAEKHGFIMVAGEPLPMKKASALVDSMEEDSRYNDKWGPACCVEILEEPPAKSDAKLFWFFGIASS